MTKQVESSRWKRKNRTVFASVRRRNSASSGPLAAGTVYIIIEASDKCINGAYSFGMIYD